MSSKIKSYIEAAKEAVSRSIVEIASSVIFFLIYVYQILYRSKIESELDIYSYKAKTLVPYYEELSDTLLYFFICIAISYSLNLIFSKSKRVIYYLSISLPFIVAAIFIFISPDYKFQSEPYLITTVCSLLLMYTAKGLTDNRAFVSNAITITTNLLASGLLASIALGVLLSVIYSICHIFGLNKPHILIEMICMFSLFVTTTLLFVTLDHKSRGEEFKAGRFLHILFNYILTPAIVIYGIILYIYFAKVAVLWTLPEGVVSITAIIFIIGGVFVAACRAVLDKKILNWVFDYFTYISIPAVILFSISVVYRISEYGLTGSRVYLLITLIILTLWMVAILFKKYAKYQYLIVISIAMYMIFTYVPGITFQDFQSRAVDIEQSTSKEKELERVRIYSSNTPDLDISKYNKMMTTEYSDKYYEINADTILILNSNKEVIHSLSCRAVLDELYRNNNIDNYTTAPFDDINGYEKPLIYKDDEVMLIFSSIGYDRNLGVVTNISPNISYIFTK